MLWPNLEKKAAANNLRQALHVARRTLESCPVPGPDALRYLRFRGERLALCPETALWTDVEAFEEAAAAALRTREPAAYRVALDLHVGELLPDDCYEEWVEGRREGLRRACLTLLVELAGIYEERGEHDAAVQELRRAVAGDPAFEEAHVGLMPT